MCGSRLPGLCRPALDRSLRIRQAFQLLLELCRAPGKTNDKALQDFLGAEKPGLPIAKQVWAATSTQLGYAFLRPAMSAGMLKPTTSADTMTKLTCLSSAWGTVFDVPLDVASYCRHSKLGICLKPSETVLSLQQGNFKHQENVCLGI